MSVASTFARVARTQRIAAKAAERRVPAQSRARDPGPLVDFVPKVNPGFRPPTHLGPMLDALERATTERVEVCVSVPVRHGKTATLVSAIPWFLAKRPTANVLYASYAHGFASKQVTRAMRLAVRAGIPLGSMRRQDQWTTAAGGSVKAVGMGGQITGEGFDLIVIDDPHKNRAEAESRVIREGVIEAFWNDLYTRQLPTGTSVVIVHARWHVNDLIGVVSRGDHPFASINLPALSRDGQALAPDLWPAEKLTEIRERVGPYVWASLYQGEPQPRGGAVFRDVTLVPADAMKPRGAFAEVIGIDLARSAKTRSDHHAAVVMRRHADGVVDVLEATRMRGSITDHVDNGRTLEAGFVRELVRLARAHPTARFAWYAGRSEEWLADLVDKAVSEALGRRVRIHVLPVESRDKWLRAQAYGTAWNAGRVRIAAHMRGDGRESWQESFVAEHTDFTGAGEQDDQVDAAVAAFDWLEAHPPGGGGGRARTTGDGSDAERVGGLV